MNFNYNYPLDPECPDIISYNLEYGDPIMNESGCFDEFYATFSGKHRADCKRCQEYGVANIEVV